MTAHSEAHSGDVLIVGGGPAGSTCARLLREAGLDVIVLDKSEFPRDKTCAGLITPQVVEELGLDLADYGRDNVLQPIHGFVTGLGHAATQRVRYSDVVSYGIRRYEFDAYLLRRCGARLLLGESFRDMRRTGEGWLVNGHIRASLVIGAGGHFCPVARSLGAQLGRDERSISAQEIEFEMTPEQASRCAVQAEEPELYFCEDLTGYGWCFRKGSYLNVGLGREDNRQLAARVQEFAAQLAGAGRIPADLPGKFKGHAYILYAHGQRPVVSEGAVLIGDAAGLAYTQSGEGIRPAIESAMMAAMTIIQACGDYRMELLAPYERLLLDRFGDRGSPPALAGVLPASLRQSIAHALMRTSWFTRRVVLDRWFLHADTAALSPPAQVSSATAAA